MGNPKITTNEYNTQMTLPLEVNEKTPVSKIHLAPKFKTYNNRQSFVILDVEGLIPEHHVARVIDEMIESILDEQLPIIPAAAALRFIPN